MGMWEMQGIRMGIWEKWCGNAGNQIRNAGDLGAKKIMYEWK